MRRLLVAAAIGATAALALAAPALAEEPHYTATTKADCGTVTVTFTNNTTGPAGADVRVDNETGAADEFTALGNIADGPNAGKPYGDRYQKVSLAAGQTAAKTVTFGEDSGDHTVAYRVWRGPETDWYLGWQTVDVKSDCKPNQTTNPPAKPKDCEAYLYAGTKQNLCDRFAAATKLNCKQAKYRVSLVDKNVDPWGLDGSGGGSRGVVGLGCESNPLKPTPSKSPAAANTGQDQAAALPVTGTPVKTFAAVAAGGVLLGAVALLVSRRRRTRFTA